MKQPLVLLHGWGLNALVWDRIMPRLEAHFVVTAIDLPGYGDDIDYFEDYSLDAVVNEVLSRAPEKANWVGWSLGATVAMAAAILRPERLKKLQLVSATPCFLTRPDWSHGVELAPFESLARDFNKDYGKAIRKFLLLQVLTNDRIQFKESRSLVRELTEDLIRSPRPWNRTLQEGLKILSRTDLRPQLARLKVETQVIAGNRDHVVPTAASEFLFHHLPNGHSFHVFRAGHLPFLQTPSKYIEALTQFMNSTQ
jgi:pimeloyl-[acyl-carrier protein] methyl ester esterase